MIKENALGSEYVRIPANIISSWCKSSRGTIFTRRADIEQSQVSVIPSRNLETILVIIQIINKKTQEN
jgi:hypothetical protein